LLLVDVVPEPEDVLEEDESEPDELLVDEELSPPDSFVAAAPFDDPPEEEPARLSVR